MSMPKQQPGKSRQDYQTPSDFVAAVKAKLDITEFGFDLAASDTNKQADAFFSEAQDALADHNDWDNTFGWNWLNPPYDNVTPWVKKASEQSFENLIAVLVPASVGSNWWRDHVHDKAHVLLLNGRITFVGAKDPYPKDCALLLYTPFIKGGYEVWTWNK